MNATCRVEGDLGQVLMHLRQCSLVGRVFFVTPRILEADEAIVVKL